MELESLFEEIYALSNHTTEYGTNYLEWPLDTATKPPMYLNESKLFEEIYFEHRLKPLFEQVLREMAQESINNNNEHIEEFRDKTLKQFGKEGYQYYNEQNQTEQEFKNDLEYSIKLIKSPENNRKFNIIRVFNGNHTPETIGYITYYEHFANDGSVLIFELSAARTVDMLNEKGKGSVTKEMKKFIYDTLKNDFRVQNIQFTCIDDENNPAKYIYQRLFPNIKPAHDKYNEPLNKIV